MKNEEEKVCRAIEKQCESKGYATPADVLMEIGILEKKKYDDWKAGRIPYLEAVCHSSLNQLSNLLKMIRSCALQKGLKPSFTYYKHKSKPLRFSKTGEPNIEQAYATHYVATNVCEKQKEAPPSE